MIEGATGLLLFIGTAAVVWWQNTRLTVLYDLCGVLEPATRIAQGDLPYLDFPFPYAPLTFLTQAAIIRLTGAVYWHHIVYCCIVAGLATVLAWRILIYLFRDSLPRPLLTAFLLSLPLTILGVYCIFPHPFYDPDATFVILLSIFLLLRLERKDFPPVRTFLLGSLLASPLFIKQNIGLAFLGSTGIVLLVMIAAGLWRKTTIRPYLLLIGGSAFGLGIALLIIHYTVGIDNYKYWTLTFAALRRTPPLAEMLAIYTGPMLAVWAGSFLIGAFLMRQDAGVKRWPSVLAVVLMSVPFVWPVIYLLIDTDASERAERLVGLWPLVLIASFSLAYIFVRRLSGIAAALPFIIDRDRSRRFSLAAALGFDLRHLAAADDPDRTGFGFAVRTGRKAVGDRNHGVYWDHFRVDARRGWFLCLFERTARLCQFRRRRDGPFDAAAASGPVDAWRLDTGFRRVGGIHRPRNTARGRHPALAGRRPVFTTRRAVIRIFPCCCFDVTNNPYNAEIRERVLASDIEWIIVKNDTEIEADTMIDSKDAIFELAKARFSQRSTALITTRYTNAATRTIRRMRMMRIVQEKTKMKIHKVILSFVGLLLFMLSAPTFVCGQSEMTCDQSRTVQESLMLEAQRKQFTVRHMSVAGNIYVRDREFRNRVLLSEGDIFNRRLLIKSVANVSRMRAIYPIALKDVKIDLARKSLDVDLLFCVKERPRHSNK